MFHIYSKNILEKKNHIHHPNQLPFFIFHFPFNAWPDVCEILTYV